MKVLIVDDEPDIRQIARLSLARVGRMDVVEAEGGTEGVRVAESERPDVVLLDMMMPVMDGPATLAALRANPATASIPVVFLTAKAMVDEIEHLKVMGAAGVLTKPFDPMALPSLLLAILAGAERGSAK